MLSRFQPSLTSKFASQRGWSSASVPLQFVDWDWCCLCSWWHVHDAYIFHEVCCTEKPTASLNADTDMHTDSGDFARQIWNN
mmetsp:Transcript_33531/g.68565  ORF Transcript_33531/g.68565 Transcript_33531/m.68565 type:complete len:82 (+) Transcript_33531:1033-1278(+)